MSESLDKDPLYRKYVPFLDSTYNLYLLIYLTHAALFQARYNEIKAFGVTSMELALLTVVQGLGESATPAEISRWMMRKRPTISGLLNRMERNGLIRREYHESDRRSYRIFLKKKAREMKDELIAIVEEVSAAATRGISARDEKEIIRLMNIINGNLNK